jgi:hypothetical protein
MGITGTTTKKTRRNSQRRKKRRNQKKSRFGQLTDRIGKNPWRIPMIFCDLCGESKDCLQKEIDSREYDICADCWRPLVEKLKGKGRVKKNRETVFLPPASVAAREPEGPTPLPERPPKIFGVVRTN